MHCKVPEHMLQYLPLHDLPCVGRGPRETWQVLWHWSSEREEEEVCKEGLELSGQSSRLLRRPGDGFRHFHRVRGFNKGELFHYQSENLPRGP